MPELPKLLVLLGAPDTMSAPVVEGHRRRLNLPGNSGLVSDFVRTLRARAIPHHLAIAYPEGPADAADLVERTGAEVLVNGICEPLTQRGALRQVARFEQETGLPTLNPARVIAGTSRPDMARRVGRAGGVRAPHCTLYEGGAGTGRLVEHIRAAGHRYPVLLRPAGSHGSAGLVRASDDADVAAAARAIGACTVTDFVDFRSADGLWRKHRMLHAGGKLFRRHMLIDDQWNITPAARAFMHEHDLFDEEQAWISRPVDPEAEPLDARVLAQFDAIGLDFGAIDYAVLPDGELVIFEINACVQVTNTVPEQWRSRVSYLESNNAEIFDAVMARARSRCAEGPAGAAA